MATSCERPDGRTARSGPALTWRSLARIPPQPRCDTPRIVAQNAVGPGAPDADEALEDRLLLVDPAVGGGRRDHRVLAAHLVHEGRHAEPVLHAPHDIEVGEARLDHHDVGAFLDV